MKEGKNVYSSATVQKAKSIIKALDRSFVPSKTSVHVFRDDGGASSVDLFKNTGVGKELSEYFKNNGFKNGSLPLDDNWKFMNIKAPDGQDWNSYFNSKLKNKEFTELGYSSTSLNQKGIEGFHGGSSEISPIGMATNLNITIPYGKKIIDTIQITGASEGRWKKEQEIILPRNTKFRVDMANFKISPDADSNSPRGKINHVLELYVTVV